MEISIDQQHLDHIRRKVQSGIYQSPDAVMAKALGLLDEHDESLAEELSGLRVEVQRGVEALRSGDYTEYTDEALGKLFDKVKNRGREQRATSLHAAL